MTAPKLQYKKMKREDLIILAQQDDMKALEELLRLEQKNIFATFTYLSKSRQDVADLTQETLLRVAKNLKNLKNPKHFKSWLNQIVTNLFYDELRKQSKKPDVISMDEEKDDENQLNIKNTIADKKCKPNEKCLSSELADIIRNSINNLPKHFRIAIVLRELQGLSYDEIAEITNTSIGTVKSRISRARNKLQENLRNYI